MNVTLTNNDCKNLVSSMIRAYIKKEDQAFCWPENNNREIIAFPKNLWLESLQNMLPMMEEDEEYETCAQIRDLQTLLRLESPTYPT